MKVVVQRVDRAAVAVGGRTLAAIERGLLLLVGIESGDDAAVVERAAEKIAGLRLFSDPGGRLNLALADVGGAILAVSQFTLAGSIDRGRRPSFEGAMEGSAARPLFDRFVASLRRAGHAVQTGEFGAAMKVELVNDGPVTFLYDSRKASPPGAR